MSTSLQAIGFRHNYPSVEVFTAEDGFHWQGMRAKIRSAGQKVSILVRLATQPAHREREHHT